MDTTILAIAGIASGPIILGLVQVAKSTGMPTKFAPLISLGIGVTFGILAYFSDVTSGSLIFFIVAGLQQGLIASGLYSIGQNTIERLSEAVNPLPPVIDPTQPDGKVE